jgi:redox-sensitive bicupin YhaK (pirin superfamily)
LRAQLYSADPKGPYMPAVTADTLTLPRIEAPTVLAQDRPLISLTTAPSGFEGEGFPVRRAFAGIPKEVLDPFIMMDQMGSVDYPPYEARGTDWHPHRGFETVTYIMDGAFIHQDSHGGGGIIKDGSTQWMTAGGGILHIETPPEQLVISGGLFHGLQLWVNLPAAQKMVSPAYQNLDADQVKLFTTPDAGTLVRLIAGDIAGIQGPGSTRTPIVMAHATILPGSQMVLPWNPAYNAIAHVVKGSGFVGIDHHSFTVGQTAVFGTGDSVTLAASPHEALDVILLGGQPIGEPVEQYGPFVMNTRAELQQAMDDYQRGRLGTVPSGGIQPYRGPRK